MYFFAYVGSNKVIDLPDHLVCPKRRRRMNPAPKTIPRPIIDILNNLLKLS
jgi:hypothetical protein